MSSTLRINSALGSVGTPPAKSVAWDQGMAPIGTPFGTTMQNSTRSILDQPIPFRSLLQWSLRLLRVGGKQVQVMASKSHILKRVQIERRQLARSPRRPKGLS